GRDRPTPAAVSDRAGQGVVRPGGRPGGGRDGDAVVGPAGSGGRSPGGLAPAESEAAADRLHRRVVAVLHGAARRAGPEPAGDRGGLDRPRGLTTAARIN